MVSSSPECKGEDTVKQTAGDVRATEGDTVTLDCTFQTSNTAYLFWYKQEVNGYPKYMLKRFSATGENAAEFKKDRFDATLNKTSVPLQISSAAVTDSAVYYCALRPTVTGNTTTLYKNLWSKDNTILINIHQREPLSDKLQHCEDLTPSKKEEFSPEGSTVTLSYRYSKTITANDYFYWYRQYPGKPPEFLILHWGTKPASNSRLSVKSDEDKIQIYLSISSAALTDSALYYCAVEPTVTGNT
ncbi:hypothetical protein NQZ68_038586 [Dissostichus eleginoides]|nr:hypothetical protein NQZ68_038586 [Dissostichus eleginoides]